MSVKDSDDVSEGGFIVWAYCSCATAFMISFTTSLRHFSLPRESDDRGKPEASLFVSLSITTLPLIPTHT